MPVCSQCQNTIPAEDVNVASDVAFCRPCNHATKLSDFVTSGRTSSMELFDPTNPPHGAWARGGPDNMELCASHRSESAWVMLGFCVVWNSGLSVFLALVISSTLNLLGVQMPNWFPSDIDGSGMGVGDTLFMWLFLTPFILAGLFMFGLVLNLMFGRTTLRIGHSDGELFTGGIGPFGWTQRFNALEVSDVRYVDRRWRDSDGRDERITQGVLVFRDGKEIEFGLNCPPERLQFLVAGAKTTLRSLVGEELLDTYDNDSSDNERGVNVELGMAMEVPVAVAVPVKEQTNPVLVKASVRKVPQGGVYT
jgi:hypothetical protein